MRKDASKQSFTFGFERSHFGNATEKKTPDNRGLNIDIVCGSAVFDVHVIAVGRAQIKLTWASDLILWIGNHFFPLANPANGT